MHDDEGEFCVGMGLSIYVGTWGLNPGEAARATRLLRPAEVSAIATKTQ
jgi:hypothetical protein